MKGQLILLLLCAALASSKNTRSWSQISRESPTIANPPSSGPWVANPPSGGPMVVDTPQGGPAAEDTPAEVDEEVEGPLGGPTVVETPQGGSTAEDTPAEVEEEVEGYESQIFPHENCNQFYLIAEGISEVLTCPAYLLYNPDTKRCDWAHKVECGDRIVPGAIEEEESAVDDEEENSSGVHVADNNPSEDNTATPRPPPPSESECRYNGQILPNENCNQFNLCSHGVPVAMHCPGNLLFNLNENVCDWPNRVHCGDRVIPEAEESEPVHEEITENESSGVVGDNEVAKEPEEIDEETHQIAEHDNGIFVIG